MSIRAVVVDGLGQASGSSGRVPPATAGRLPWVHGAVASPISRYPRYAGDRTSWMPDWLFGCVVEAEDGTMGFALATEKVYDMAVRLCAPFGDRRQDLA